MEDTDEMLYQATKAANGFDWTFDLRAAIEYYTDVYMTSYDEAIKNGKTEEESSQIAQNLLIVMMEYGDQINGDTDE
ncbi:hypothetical protein HOS79_gp125 [Lactobacillus phage Nyseid]|uniref:Uncharacterized protein n=1 Tax=Lactobacillus phage Nyseid TaxID=2079432 RepID=A0A2K9VCF3_9CAUD|nr:hypothetical protein HOS79_gp125 [Lactobacillus phage Nyseid]AUV59844.1 hypothetical protein [Lactobacillus phage Nyseid]